MGQRVIHTILFTDGTRLTVNAPPLILEDEASLGAWLDKTQPQVRFLSMEHVQTIIQGRISK